MVYRMKTPLFCLLVLLAACSPGKKQVQTVLHEYTMFVDSIYSINEKWKQKNDTEIVEMLLDANTTKFDTIITLAKDKKTMVGESSGHHEGIMRQYRPLLKAVEQDSALMDEEMRKTFATVRQRFDNLLIE